MVEGSASSSDAPHRRNLSWCLPRDYEKERPDFVGESWLICSLNRQSLFMWYFFKIYWPCMSDLWRNIHFGFHRDAGIVYRGREGK